MSAHYRYYVREMRILGYTQLLESYRSLTLTYMAQAFGVTEEYIDKYGKTYFFSFVFFFMFGIKAINFVKFIIFGVPMYIVNNIRC